MKKKPLLPRKDSGPVDEAGMKKSFGKVNKKLKVFLNEIRRRTNRNHLWKF